MFVLFYLISNAWSAISAISNCKTLFPQSNKSPYHAKNTLLYNFYAILCVNSPLPGNSLGPPLIAFKREKK